MSYNNLSDVLSATAKSYYNSPRSTKKSHPVTYGTRYNERLSSSGKYDEARVQPVIETVSSSERIEDWLSSPVMMKSSLSMGKLPRASSGREDHSQENGYTSLRPTEASRYSNGLHTPRHSKLSQSTFFDRSYKSKLLHEKKTLVLDLDETLIHASLDPIVHYDFIVKLSDATKFYVAKRPGLDEFLEKMSRIYDLVIYTAGEKEYATKIIERLDVKRRICKILDRDHCPKSEYGLDKDLLLLGKDLKGVIFIDNLEENFRLQKDNGLKIIDFHWKSQHDDELKKLIPFLEYMADLPDVRPIRHWHAEFHTRDGKVHAHISNQTSREETFEEDSYKAYSIEQKPTRLEEKIYTPRSKTSYRYEKLALSTEKPLPTDVRLISDLKKHVKDKKEREMTSSLSTQFPEITRDSQFYNTFSDFRHGETYTRERQLDTAVPSVESYSKKLDEEHLTSNMKDYTESSWNYPPKKNLDEDKLLNTWSSYGNFSDSSDRSSEGARYKSDYGNDDIFRKTSDRWNYNERVESNSFEMTKEAPRESSYDSALRATKSSDSSYSGSLNSSLKVTNVANETKYQSDADEFEQFRKRLYTPKRSWVRDSEQYNDGLSATDKKSRHDDYKRKTILDSISAAEGKVGPENAEKLTLINELYERIAFLEKKLREKGVDASEYF